MMDIKDLIEMTPNMTEEETTGKTGIEIQEITETTEEVPEINLGTNKREEKEILWSKLMKFNLELKTLDLLLRYIFI